MWKLLKPEDLQTVLAEDELDKIKNISVKNPNIVEQTLYIVSNFVRGALSAKGYRLSTEKGAIPESYELLSLIFARHELWTRFPGSDNFALDEVRKAEFEWAKDCILKASLDVSEIEPEHDPENPDAEGYKPKMLQGSIKVPYLRYPQYPYGNEFNNIINDKNLRF